MKYLCLAFYDPARLAAMPPEERRAMPYSGAGAAAPCGRG